MYQFLSSSLLVILVLGCSARGRQGPAPASADYAIGYGPAPVLPPPDTTASHARFVPVEGWPEGRRPVAPTGFTVTEFARDLVHPRWLHVLSNGDVLVAESNRPGRPGEDSVSYELRRRAGNRGASANRITLIRDDDRDGRGDRRWILLAGLKQPFGMETVGAYLYVANTDGIVRYPFGPGDTVISAAGEPVTELPADGYNNHWTRNILASPDGTTLFATVGSGTNVDTEGTDRKDPRRAAILAIDLATRSSRVHASGLRNPNGLAWEPVTGSLWAAVNERDGLGDDLVPDFITRVEAGAFYGWPYFYSGGNRDPRHTVVPESLVGRSIAPDYATGAHTATMDIEFSRGGSFPSAYRQGAFISQRGSWNRSRPAGFRVLFVPFENGRPAGAPVDILTGFLDPARGTAYGRPVGLEVLPDGSLLVADDAGDRIWQVSYPGERTDRAVPKLLATVDNLPQPESALFDPDQDVWFISNIEGPGYARDDNGSIARMDPDGRLLDPRFVSGRDAAVELHGPTGMALTGDTLWVADFDVVRAFHRRTGAPLGMIDFAAYQPRRLNDIAVGPDGALYLTDTGVAFDSAGNRSHPGPDRIYRVGPDRRVSVVLETAALAQPNGILWNEGAGRFLIAPIAGNSILAWRPGGQQLDTVATGAGRYDGLVELSGRFLVSSWADSTVGVLRGRTVVPLIRGVPGVADLGVDRKRSRVALPLLAEGRLELWQLTGSSLSSPFHPSQ